MTRPRGLASKAFPCLPLLLLLLAAPSALALDATFDFYPNAAQSCLSKAAKSSACSGDTAKELNTCLCGNGGQFVEKVILCLAQEDNDDLGDVYTTMDNACSTSGTPLSWKWSDWVDTAKSAKSSSSSSSSSTKTTSTKTKTSSTTSTESTSTTLTTTTASSASSDSSSPSSSKATATATATNSPTSSPSPSPGDSSSNLSTTATIGIAVGVSVAGVAAIAALAFFLVRKRNRASRPPMTYSMLTPEKYNGAGGAATSYPPHGPSPSNLGGGGGGAAGFDSAANETPLYTIPTYLSKSQCKQSYTALSGTSPDSGLEQQKQHNFLSGWEPPTHAQYAGPYAPPQTGPVELPPQMQPVSNVFELDSHGVAAAPRPVQPALQPIAERERESRMFRPYMPT